MGPEGPAGEAIRRAWAATVAALPVGTRITGQVIGRQRFGVFIRIDDVPGAVALAEITAMPQGMELPARGASVEREVFWHAHNHQERVRLDDWRTSGDRAVTTHTTRPVRQAPPYR
ncbi:hypothetical protein GCM10010251_79120 [Streptomyces aurantiogriseus]|uniref:RNA-binding protein n=1 Tax=Streptomyces aurantiogriseus TaxID=66870 RepID=A0A918KYR8_9ACTN|nr:hypothetical protein GCM10010251_79120 [Streptomyces aurantiogriseus]